MFSEVVFSLGVSIFSSTSVPSFKLFSILCLFLMCASNKGLVDTMYSQSSQFHKSENWKFTFRFCCCGFRESSFGGVALVGG